VRTAQASVLGEADAAVGRDLARFDLANGRFNEATVLPALYFRNGGLQILNLRMILPHENHERHIGNSTDPGITNQLRIQGQQPFRFFRVATPRGLPVDQAALAIEFAQGVDVGDEFVVSGKLPGQLELQITLRAINPDAIILGEPFEQVNSLVDEAIPGFSFLIFKGSVPEGAPGCRPLWRR
jgi:hypothetical protein